MMEWIRLGIEILTFAGLNGFIFYSFNKKLKALQVDEKQIDVVKKQDEEWQELYQETRNRVKDLEVEIKQLREQKDKIQRQNGLLELNNQALNWYRCTINNCPNRRPPHVFDKDGNELEACS